MGVCFNMYCDVSAACLHFGSGKGEGRQARSDTVYSYQPLFELSYCPRCRVQRLGALATSTLEDFSDSLYLLRHSHQHLLPPSGVDRLISLPSSIYFIYIFLHRVGYKAPHTSCQKSPVQLLGLLVAAAQPVAGVVHVLPAV